jgi:hypothetical protein
MKPERITLELDEIKSEMRNAYKVSIGKQDMRRSLGTSTRGKYTGRLKRNIHDFIVHCFYNESPDFEV